MKKLFLLFAALLTATVMNLQAQDTEAPTNLSADYDEESYFSATLIGKAYDNSGTVILKAFINGTEVASVTTQSGVDTYFKVTGLNQDTEYEIEIQAHDAAGNVCEDTEDVDIKTEKAPAPASAPTWDATKVISIYSDAYTQGKAWDIASKGQSTVVEEGNLAANNKALYCSESDYLIWNFQDGALDGSKADSIHFDVWVEYGGGSIKFTPVWVDEDEEAEYLESIDLESGWNRISLKLDDFMDINKANITAIKWADMPTDCFIDNVYLFGNTSVEEPDMHDFLYFVGLNGNDTVKLNKIGSNYANLTATFEYSTDRTTWNNYTWPDNNGKGGYAIALENAGDTVFFRAKGTKGLNATVGLNVSTNFTFAFGADDQIAAGGNIMSLYDATCEQDTMTECGFYKLFNGAKRLVTAPKLPAKKMATNCYSYIFNGCTSLIAAPELKATTLDVKCYAYMFQNCTTLQVDTCADDAQCTSALLVVPATGATNWNYKMFAGCKGDAKYTAQTGIQLNGHYCIKEYKEPDMHDMLHFVSLKDNGTVRLNKYGGNDLANLTATFEYSKDRKTWTEYTWGGTDNKKGAAITLANAGDTVFFRAKGINGKNATMSYNDVTYFLFAFNSGDSIAAGGNVMSLYDATCKQDTMTAYGFCSLFRDCAKKLVSVSELKLPVTKLAKGCYYAMFYNCMKITDVPALPVTTLAPSCYVFMFYRCSSLTAAPELPATTLADNCYSNMFSTCTALTQAPALPATILASKCYNLMFTGCSSLTSAPELKATALADSCYKQMFKGCTKLEVNSFSVICDGVEFEPTTTGAEPTDWNLNMFYGCKGDTALTKTYGIQLGGHYCIREYGKPLPIYGRKLKVAGNYGTICLAKKFTSMEGVEGLYVPASKDASKLYCEEVDVNEVEAGKAYIFKAEAGKDSVTFVLDGEAVPAPVVEEGDYMIGWLAADSTLTAESDYYGLNGNTISKLAAGSKIKQNCAVIDLDNVPAATSAPSRKYVSFGINGTNTTTGVVDVNATRMSDVHKFVYNGQLIIIRDGVEYNAMGVKL